MSHHKPTIIVFCSALIVFISMGIRQSFGLFLTPISRDLGIGREVFSLAIAWQNLIFGLPVLGIVADYFGPRWVVAGGALLYAICFLFVVFNQHAFGPLYRARRADGHCTEQQFLMS